MAFTRSYSLIAAPDQVLRVVATMPQHPQRPRMPKRLTGPIAQTEIIVRVRESEFVIGYRSRVEPGPRAEVRGRVVPAAAGGASVIARVGLMRQMTAYNGWILAAGAAVFGRQGSWGVAAALLVAAVVAVLVNRGYDAGVSPDDEEARFLAECLECALAPLMAAPHVALSIGAAT